METNWNHLIERYLNNELSAEGKAAFEAELQRNRELQKEFELHQLTKELIQRSSLRTLVNQSGKWFHGKKILINSGIALVIAGALAAAVYFVAVGGNESNKKETPELMEKSMIESLEKYLAFENIDPEYFKFTGESDVFLSESGVLLSITDESFLLDGKPYAGEAIVQWQEAQNASDIVKAGLSTKSGDKLLETQGMFSLNAFTPDGKKLGLTEKGVYAQVPVDKLKKDMMLFTGVPGKDGTIDWQDPKELERLPKPKDMSEMDLFPPKYEPKLNELKWFTEKAKRDSLYLSFEEGNFPQIEENYIDTKTQDTLVSFAVSREIIPPVVQNNPDRALEFPINIPMELPEDKVHWSFRVQLLENEEALIIAKVVIEQDFVIPALRCPKGSFWAPTSFELKKSSNYKLLGQATETNPTEFFDNEFNVKLPVQLGTCEFKQKIKLVNKLPFILIGSYSGIGLSNKTKTIYPFGADFSVQINSTEQAKSHIPPSKVLAIWNKKFNNTNLATQDFEDRMKAIHETCDEKVFDVYAKNLNTPLWELDQRVVKLGYPQFQHFADQKVGTVQINDAHQKNLNAFYEKAIETIRETGRKDLETALQKERQWDNELQDERSKEVLRKGLRESANLNEEYGFNLRNVYKQLGVTAGFQLHGGGTIVNIDKYVWDATVARQSTLITDPETGKIAQITYEPLSLEVKESGQYDKLYMYLFSKEINSYQRLDFKEGKLDYNLNGDMNYHAFIVGMNEKGYFYHQINELKAEGTVIERSRKPVSLDEISEKEFEKRINILNEHRTDKPMDLKDELNWLFKEKANYIVQKKRRENEAFRKEIRPTIYMCQMEIYSPR